MTARTRATAPAATEAELVEKATRRRGPAKTGNPSTDRKANAAKAAKAPATPRRRSTGGGSAEDAMLNLAKAGERAAAEKATPAPAAKAPAKPKAEPKAKAPKVAPKLPTGYAVRYENGAYDLAKPGEGAAEGGPAWIVICTAHGTTTTAEKAKDGDALGRKAARPGWCKKCAAVAK